MTGRREIAIALLDADAAKRFWASVAVGDASDCWLWQGPRDRGGYGRFNFDRRITVLAHRHAWQFNHGQIAPSDLAVCHRCDTPACCNPDHLWLGTAAENVADMDAKGRRRVVTRRGEGCNTAKLTESDVRAIRASSEPTRRLAAHYGVSTVQINNIRSRRQWRHVV